MTKRIDDKAKAPIGKTAPPKIWDKTLKFVVATSHKLTPSV